MSEDFRIDPTIAYDMVELPSRGIHYSNKKKSVRVAYLTAADENILSSQNLIAQSGVVEELLKRKILDRDLPFEDIVEEDKQAILIFLRNTAFGTEYKMNLTDPKTGEKFTTVIDLAVLKLKDFVLVEDSNGEYTYFLQKSQVPITFKFLTQKQETELEKIKEGTKEGVAPLITKRLEFMIRSVAGSRNQMEIYNFINVKMPIKDSQDFRKFVEDNKPGLDLRQEVKTPSGDIIHPEVGFGVEFFRPFFGI